MWKYLTNINSNVKVLCDKTFDYVTYYAGYSDDVDSDEPSDKNDNSKDDTLADYEGVLKIELYQDENSSMRIYPASGLYNEYSTFWGKPTPVIDNIYLGSAYNAASYNLLKGLDIKVIINATTEISNYYQEDFTYIRYKLYDNNVHSIKKYLERSFADIQHHQQNTKGNILIHCFMGASRSASIVLYYLMRTQKHEDGKPYTFDDAVSYLRNKRITVNPTFRLTKDLASSMLPKNENLEYDHEHKDID
jgi:Dual specificity phosphatase, catalytic domain